MLQEANQDLMKKKNLLTLLGIALVVAIISTGIFYGLFVDKLSSSTGSGSLVVAAKALKAGTTLGPADVKLIPWPTPKLPKGAFGSAPEVTGMVLFDSLAEDEPVLDSRMVSPSQNGHANIPAGMRGVSVHVTDSTGVMALLHVGHHVDVQVVRKSNAPGAEVRTALRNLEVLSVTPQVEETSQGFKLPVVTLLAKPNDADVLAAADSGGRVRLTLRNPLDEESQPGKQVSLDSVMRAR
jgi:pilus assembly protein CpaB